MQYFEVPLFEGLNLKTSPFLTKTGHFVECQNIDLSKIGIARKRGEYSLKNSQISASKNILGLGMFTRSNGTYEHFAVCDGASNSDIYKDASGTWTAQSQALTKTETVRFQSMPELDTFFACNISDATRSYNGSSWSTSTNVTSAPKSKYISTHETRLFLGNVDVGGTKYPTRYYFSSSGTGGSLTWSANDFYVLPNIITGFGRIGEEQLAFTEYEVFRADAYDKKLLANVGAVTQETIATSNNGWCMFANRDGAFATDGANVQKFSQAVQEYFDGITQSSLSDLTGAVLGDHYYLYIGNISLNGDTLTNVVLDYDFTQNKWSRYSLGETVKHLSKFIDSDGNENLYFGNDDGEVWKFLSGTGQNSTAFNAFVETPFYYFDTVNNYVQIELWGKNLSGVSVLYRTTQADDWKPIDGEFKEDHGVLTFNSDQSEKIAFKFTETGKDLQFELYKFRFGYEPVYADKI